MTVKINIVPVRMINALTKDQLSDIMSKLPDEVLADLVFFAEVELKDRQYRKSLPFLLKPVKMGGTLRTSV